MDKLHLSHKFDLKDGKQFFDSNCFFGSIVGKKVSTRRCARFDMDLVIHKSVTDERTRDYLVVISENICGDLKNGVRHTMVRPFESLS